MFRSCSKPALVFGIYLSYVTFFALAPFDFHRDAGVSMSDWVVQRFEGMSSLWRMTAWDLWTNILLFLPFGIFFVLLPFVAHVPPWPRILSAVGCACLVSFGIEVAQTLLSRHPSLADIACNGLGSGLGAILGTRAYPGMLRLFARGIGCRCSRSWLGVLMVSYWVALCMLFSFPLPLVADFSNWDPEFRLHLGNDPSSSRPWRGDFYGVTIYDRALPQEEVRSNFTAGPVNDMDAPLEGRGIVVRYDFSEGFGSIIYDRAKSSRPADLNIENSSLVRWVAPAGLSIMGAASISSFSDSARPAYERLSAAGDMSLESWVVPADLSQPGPDLFISSSNRVNLWNFALAQDAGDLVFWLRTPLTGTAGRRGELRTANQPLTAGLQHVVITYASRIAALYLDGIEQTRLVLDQENAVFDTIVDEIGFYYESGLRSVFFFPLGVLAYLSLGRFTPRWMPFAAALAGAGVIEMARVCLITRPADPSFVAVSAGTVLVGSIAAIHLFSIDCRNVSIHT